MKTETTTLPAPPLPGMQCSRCEKGAVTTKLAKDGVLEPRCTRHAK